MGLGMPLLQYGNPSGFRLSVGVEGFEFALWAEGS